MCQEGANKPLWAGFSRPASNRRPKKIITLSFQRMESTKTINNAHIIVQGALAKKKLGEWVVGFGYDPSLV